ncbi:Hypothetical protein A7982_00903 [Minicystis rosea]|nr:Hypothetical protein A7982_00903 [Minicystis rosea]
MDGCVVVESDGGCQRLHCEVGWAIAGVAVDAGELSLTGGLMDITADASGYNQSLETPLFEPGDMLELALLGNERFTPVTISLEAPPLPVVAPPAAGPLLRSAPLTITWNSAPGPGTVTASITTYPDAWQEGQTTHSGDVSEKVSCEAAVSAGSLTMPVSLLSMLPPSTVTQADLRVGVATREVRERDGFRIDFSVGGYATLSEGGMYWFSRDLQ